MVDEEFLKRMKAIGVKSFTMDESGRVVDVEFFPSIPALDLDTLMPPAPAEPAGATDPVPSAIARILQKGSVS